MRKNILSNYLLFFGGALLVVAGGCKTKRDLTNTTTSPVATVSAPEKPESLWMDSIRNKQLNFSTLSVKAKAEIGIGKKENNVTLTIRIKKDEAIWVAVTALGGIEVARALITPDSLRLMNKAEDTYLKKPFSFLHEYSGQNVDFKTLQALLIGNCSERFLTDNAVFSSGSKQLSGALNTLLFKLSFNNNYKVTQANLSDSNAKQELTIAYTGLSAPNGQELPQSVSIKSAAETSLSLNLEYSKAVFNQPVDMPFSVPKRFEVIN